MIVLALLSVLFIGGAGNIINDIADYETDKINKPERPIPSGKIKIQTAYYYSAILFALGFGITFLLNTYMIILAAFNIFIEFIYSYKLKARPLIGNFLPSWLAASSFIFGSLLMQSLNPIVLLLAGLAFLANTGREIAKDIEDIKGDKKAKITTMPVMLGHHFSAGIAIVFVLFAVLLSPAPYILNLLSINYLYIVAIADILFGVSCFFLLTNPSKSQKTMKIAMFIAILAFLIGFLY